jgi:hypothetical protein
MRTGTTVYRQMLASSESVFDIGEAFHVDTSLNTNFYSFWRKYSISNTSSFHPYYARQVWNEFLTEMRELYGRPILVVDTKVEYFHLLGDAVSGQAWPIFPMLESDAKIVRIKRRNVFSRIVSLELAHRTKNWAIANSEASEAPRLNGVQNFPSQAPSVAPRSIVIDEGTLIARIEKELESINTIDDLIRNTFDPITFVYEDMFDADGRWNHRVIEDSAKLLDVPPQSLCSIPRLAKQNKYNNRDIIDNYERIEKILRKSAHGWMLDEA